jgi:hypothetical protein
MLFEFAGRTIRVNGGNECDSSFFEFVDDCANGHGVLLNEQSDFGGEFSVGVEPRDN